MGYKLHLVFDPAEKYDRKAFVDKLHKAGVVICDEPGFLGGYILLPELAGIILFDHEETIKKGHWAYIRPPESLEGLTRLTQIAEQLGGRLFDPALEMFVTEENAADVLASMVRFQTVVARLFGRTRRPDE